MGAKDSAVHSHTHCHDVMGRSRNNFLLPLASLVIYGTDSYYYSTDDSDDDEMDVEYEMECMFRSSITSLPFMRGVEYSIPEDYLDIFCPYSFLTSVTRSVFKMFMLEMNDDNIDNVLDFVNRILSPSKISDNSRIIRMEENIVSLIESIDVICEELSKMTMLKMCDNSTVDTIGRNYRMILNDRTQRIESAISTFGAKELPAFYEWLLDKRRVCKINNTVALLDDIALLFDIACFAYATCDLSSCVDDSTPYSTTPDAELTSACLLNYLDGMPMDDILQSI